MEITQYHELLPFFWTINVFFIQGRRDSYNWSCFTISASRKFWEAGFSISAEFLIQLRNYFISLQLLLHLLFRDCLKCPLSAHTVLLLLRLPPTYRENRIYPISFLLTSFSLWKISYICAMHNLFILDLSCFVQKCEFPPSCCFRSNTQIFIMICSQKLKIKKNDLFSSSSKYFPISIVICFLFCMFLSYQSLSYGSYIINFKLNCTINRKCSFLGASVQVQYFWILFHILSLNDFICYNCFI